MYNAKAVMSFHAGYEKTSRRTGGRRRQEQEEKPAGLYSATTRFLMMQTGACANKGKAKTTHPR